MSFSSVLQALDLLDSALVSGERVLQALRSAGLTTVETAAVTGASGSTDFIRITVPGSAGRVNGGRAPTLGIIGILGGIGARPHHVGLVSDADGAVAAVACALKLAKMRANGDALPGDVLISTHVCPTAPLKAHDPVPFVTSPVSGEVLNREQVRPEMDAIVSIVTTRGNRVINHRGFAISPTVKAGWILRPADDLLDIQQNVTGRLPVVLPLSMPDLTPNANGLYHLNTIVEPAQATDAPVVGVAMTSEVPVAGSATGASPAADIDQAVRFALEVAKAFGTGRCHFYDEAEWAKIQTLYGSMKVLQTAGSSRGPRPD
jgi:uncharacterized protein DUF1177